MDICLKNLKVAHVNLEEREKKTKKSERDRQAGGWMGGWVP